MQKDLSTENKIISFLKKKYKAQVIVLAGSRARGEHTAKSDWDLYVYTTKKVKSEYISFEREHLDVCIQSIPFEKNYTLKNAFSPIVTLRVLYDNSKGGFAKVLKRTQSDYNKGPLVAWKESYRGGIKTLNRQIERIEKYENFPEIQFIYTSVFYEFVLAAYFERRNQWTPHPRAIFEYLKKNDKRMLSLLKKLRTAEGKSATTLAKTILKHVLNTNKVDKT